MNEANPALGILIFTLGGLAGAVFYLPLTKVKQWAWESYWLTYAVFGLIVVPWVLALATSPNLFAVLGQAPSGELLKIFLCGAAWGVGGLTWGLMIRYLGVGLGLAIGCGLCSAAGTLIPKLLDGSIGDLFKPGAGIASLIGVAVSLAGIIGVGLAGMSKERELPEEEKKKAVAEYDFRKGILVALFSGLMSASLGIGLQSGSETQKLACSIAPATAAAWQGMPVLVVALLGGALVNILWCLFLNVKNKTTGDYVKAGAPLAANLAFAAVAGAIWCSQFICFKTGEPQMGNISYVGWAVLMASAILFSSLLGILRGEWKGTGGRTRILLAAGLALLLVSAVISGYSGHLAQQASAPAAAAP